MTVLAACFVTPEELLVQAEAAKVEAVTRTVTIMVLVTTWGVEATTSRATTHELVAWNPLIRHKAMRTVPVLLLVIPLWETEWKTSPLY